mmetsp:Transcript_42216/g.88613  ORF Transcript_42216/g.88613 Transcript_42216/m.88613 type:complete len:85 (-) Transcript_42216:173-427(-)
MLSCHQQMACQCLDYFQNLYLASAQKKMSACDQLIQNVLAETILADMSVEMDGLSCYYLFAVAGVEDGPEAAEEEEEEEEEDPF